MKKKLMAGMLALLMLLCGCSLLPAEEVYSTSIVRPKTEVEVTYSVARAEVGEVVLTTRLSVKYASVSRQDLAFSISGAYYDRTYVANGDFVEAGDIIMSLDASEIESEIESTESRLASLEMQLRQVNEEMEFYIERGAARAELTRSEFDEEAVRSRYAAAIRDLEDKIYVCRAELDQLMREYETYFVRAPFSGTVTYLAKHTEFDLSEEGKRVAQVSDLSHSVFSAMADCEDALDPEEIYIISSSAGNFEAHYISAEELGAERESDGSKSRVYFQLTIPPLDLQENATGNVIVTLALKEGVLRVPNAAVIETENGSAVYILEENGLRSIRYVETGLVGDHYTEIISGLEEGETVIL